MTSEKLVIDPPTQIMLSVIIKMLSIFQNFDSDKAIMVRSLTVLNYSFTENKLIVIQLFNES